MALRAGQSSPLVYLAVRTSGTTVDSTFRTRAYGPEHHQMDRLLLLPTRHRRGLAAAALGPGAGRAAGQRAPDALEGTPRAVRSPVPRPRAAVRRRVDLRHQHRRPRRVTPSALVTGPRAKAAVEGVARVVVEREPGASVGI